VKIPMGRALCYSDIATRSCPKASRAVGAASEKIACRRGAVPSRPRQRRRADRLSLGITRKQAMLGWEAGQVGIH